MGFIAVEFNITNYYIDYYKKIYNKNYADINMLELGDQIFYKNHPSVGILSSDVFSYHTAKEYFQSKGINHVSVDFNGENGAIPLDLSKPLPENFYKNFDIVTNVGTIEHVEHDQYQSFKNVHDSIKVNGFFISFMPKVDSFDHNHCPWFYNIEFFRDLSSSLNYTIHHVGEILYPSVNNDMGTLISCVLQKNIDNEFIIEKEIFHRNLFKNKFSYNSY